MCFPADSCNNGVCCFEKGGFEGLDDKQFPALTAYIAAASVSSSRGTESGSGGTGTLDQSKTVGKGRIIGADRNGGRDGLIGDRGKSFECCVDGHGHRHGHEQIVGSSSLNGNPSDHEEVQGAPKRTQCSYGAFGPGSGSTS